MPNALSIGVDYNLFWHLNITKLKPFYVAHELIQKREMKELEISAYIYGIYTKYGVACGMNNKNKFPDKPINFFKENEETKELTEEEIQRQRETLVLSLQIMQTNFELNKDQELVP